MKRRYPSHLRLHVEDSARTASASDVSRSSSAAGIAQDEVQEVLRAFTDATGWSIAERPAPSNATNSVRNHHLTNVGNGKRWRLVETIVQDGVLDSRDLSEVPGVSMDRAQLLLSAIERMVDRMDHAEETVRRQEAELATSVGVTSHSDRQRETADRLESILDSVCRSVGAVAGALYLLDDDTSSLKMRSCVGLPKTRLSAPPRELRGSLADLEALLGNAVLLSDIERMPEWPSPENFAAALVVPIGSTTMPHGTMWFWSENPRSYSPTEIEVANLAAGRVMSEIEQSVMGQEVHQSRAIKKQLDTASLIQASMLPDNQVLHHDYDINGWTFQNGRIGGGFHHWDVNSQEMLTIAVGHANQPGPEGAIVSTSIQSVVRTLWQGHCPPTSILRNINDMLWSMQEADWTASVGLIQINPSTGYGSICSAGDIQSFIISHRGFRPISTHSPLIAAQPDTLFPSNRFVLQPGEILLAFTSNILAGTNGSPLPTVRKKGNKPISYSTLDQNSMLQIVRDMSDERSSDIAGYLARTLPTFDRDQQDGPDRSLIIVKNIRKAVP